MFSWLRNIVRPKNNKRAPKTTIPERTRGAQKRSPGRPKNKEPSVHLNLRLPSSLKKDFIKYCESRNQTVNYTVMEFMKRAIAESKVLDYRTFTALRRKPRKREPS